MSELVEFEKWFCGLNADFPMDQLSRIHGRYFYTTTHTLYELYVENKRLREAGKLLAGMAVDELKQPTLYRVQQIMIKALEKADE